jgi:hypothetical protein
MCKDRLLLWSQHLGVTSRQFLKAFSGSQSEDDDRMSVIRNIFFLGFLVATGCYAQYCPLTGCTMTGPLIAPSVSGVFYASAYSSLSSALTAASGATLVVTSQYTISSTTVIPSSVKLRIEQGGGFNITSGYLQIEGPLDAGLYQIFFGNQTVYFYGGSGYSDKIYPQWFGAMGNAKSSGFTCPTSSNVVTLYSGVGSGNWLVGDPVTLVGAGAAGTNLTTTIQSITNNTMVDIGTNCLTTVSSVSPMYNEDDTAALNAWAASLRGTAQAGGFTGTNSGYNMSSQLGPSLLYVPKGQYNLGCTSPVTLYTGEVITFESSNVTTSAVFTQCNINVIPLQLNPNNYTPTGQVTTDNIGNGTMNNVNIRSSYDVGGINQPMIWFEPAYNGSPTGGGWSDYRINNLVCEGVNGSCIAVGFGTTTSASMDATAITVANGVYFSNQEPITIVGAGSLGQNLSTVIQTGGGTNSITISPAIITSVSNATVFPATDKYGLILNFPELDVACWRGCFSSGHLCDGHDNFAGFSDRTSGVRSSQ